MADAVPSDISSNELLPLYESARIKRAVVQVELHLHLLETGLLEFCKENGVVFLAFAPLVMKQDRGRSKIQ